MLRLKLVKEVKEGEADRTFLSRHSWVTWGEDIKASHGSTMVPRTKSFRRKASRRRALEWCCFDGNPPDQGQEQQGATDLTSLSFCKCMLLQACVKTVDSELNN